MVNMIIDGKHISAEENITIMEAAERNGIPIPKLCYLKGINEIAACRVCVVELEGKEKLITSCNNVVKDGMVIYTNSPKVRNHRRNTVQLLLSQHDNRCVVCPRNGNCQLQQVACDLNILDIPFRQEPEYQPWDKNFPLIRNSAKCIKCMRCVQVCDKIQGLGIWDVEGTGSRTTVNVAGHKTIREADCALCGQCITHCPVGALSERDDTEKVWDAIENKDKIVVAQVAPAVRAAWGEELGLTDEDAPVGKIFDALKRMGVDYAFDTVFSADLTIMEESTEFIKRFTSGELKERPMFTSCCPGWVRFVKTQFPYMVNYLSTAKSPQQMFGAVMKTYFAEKLGVSPDQIFTLSIMPCVAKKGEREVEWYEENGEYETEIEKGGEVALEQFHISYLMNKHLNFRFGHMIVPVGLTNAHHEPLNFFGVYRPEGETTILPSTWHETGVALFGDLGNFDYELQVVSGLDPQGFRMENWVGKGTQGAFEETQFTHPAFVARVNYNGVKKFKGLRVGASFYYNQPSKNSSKPLRNQGEKYPLTIVTADAQYKSPNNNLIARGNIVYGHLGNSNALTKVNNNSSSASGYPNSTVAETAVSYAAEVGYNVGSFFSRKAPRIYPFVRYEYYNPMQSVEKGSNKLADRRLQKSVITAGLNYYALPNLVVKADYAHRIVGKGDYNSQNMVSVGIAYIGWFLSR